MCLGKQQGDAGAQEVRVWLLAWPSAGHCSLLGMDNCPVSQINLTPKHWDNFSKHTLPDFCNLSFSGFIQLRLEMPSEDPAS